MLDGKIRCDYSNAIQNTSKKKCDELNQPSKLGHTKTVKNLEITPGFQFGHEPLIDSLQLPQSTDVKNIVGRSRSLTIANGALSGRLRDHDASALATTTLYIIDIATLHKILRVAADKNPATYYAANVLQKLRHSK